MPHLGVFQLHCEHYFYYMEFYELIRASCNISGNCCSFPTLSFNTNPVILFFFLLLSDITSRIARRYSDSEVLLLFIKFIHLFYISTRFPFLLFFYFLSHLPFVHPIHSSSVSVKKRAALPLVSTKHGISTWVSTNWTRKPSMRSRLPKARPSVRDSHCCHC